MNIPDAYDLFMDRERELERQRAKCPVCDNPRCKKRIQDEFYYRIDNEILCENCMQDRYMHRTEDYME